MPLSGCNISHEKLLRLMQDILVARQPQFQELWPPHQQSPSHPQDISRMLKEGIDLGLTGKHLKQVSGVQQAGIDLGGSLVAEADHEDLSRRIT